MVTCAEPEVHCHLLALEDEFMVVACDGLWDMLSSQRCVEIARRHLRDHNDPAACAQFLVRILHQGVVAMINISRPCKEASTTVDSLGLDPHPSRPLLLDVSLKACRVMW